VILSRSARAPVGALALCAAALSLAPAPIRAHEIPFDVRVLMFLKPEGNTLRVLARVPIASTGDAVRWPMRGPEFLDLPQIEPGLRQAATILLADELQFYENGEPLGYPNISKVQLSLPSNDAFSSYETALAHVNGAPLPPDEDLTPQQGFLDALLEYPIQSESSKFSMEPRVMRLGVRVLTVLRFLAPGEPERAFQIHDNPGLVHLDPGWFNAAWQFVVEGFYHILGGIDHLLFLLCLVIPFRQFGSLVRIVTAFTVAHSITLIASAYGMAPEAGWFPPLVETLIAASIVYMALENIVAPGLKRRWLITFGFGLIHGFGFSFALRDSLQFAGDHLITALLSFNVGVELGQLLVLVLMVPALAVLFRSVVAERIGIIILSALVAHTGWHWMTERGGQLLLYPVEMPVFDVAFFAWLTRWLILAVIVAAAGWMLSGLFGKAKRQELTVERR
jgi:hypothetical protein